MSRAVATVDEPEFREIGLVGRVGDGDRDDCEGAREGQLERAPRCGEQWVAEVESKRRELEQADADARGDDEERRDDAVVQVDFPNVMDAVSTP